MKKKIFVVIAIIMLAVGGIIGERISYQEIDDIFYEEVMFNDVSKEYYIKHDGNKLYLKNLDILSKEETVLFYPQQKITICTSGKKTYLAIGLISKDEATDVLNQKRMRYSILGGIIGVIFAITAFFVFSVGEEADKIKKTYY